MSSDVDDATPTLRPIIDPTAENGLKARSQVMVDKITFLRREQIRGVIGRFEGDAMARLESALLVVLGLTR